MFQTSFSQRNSSLILSFTIKMLLQFSHHFSKKKNCNNGFPEMINFYLTHSIYYELFTVKINLKKIRLKIKIKFFMKSFLIPQFSIFIFIFKTISLHKLIPTILTIQKKNLVIDYLYIASIREKSSLENLCNLCWKIVRRKNQIYNAINHFSVAVDKFLCDSWN